MLTSLSLWDHLKVMMTGAGAGGAHFYKSLANSCSKAAKMPHLQVTYSSAKPSEHRECGSLLRTTSAPSEASFIFCPGSRKCRSDQSLAREMLPGSQCSTVQPRKYYSRGLSFSRVWRMFLSHFLGSDKRVICCRGGWNLTSSHCLSRHLCGGRGGYPLAGKGSHNLAAAACGFAQAVLAVAPWHMGEDVPGQPSSPRGETMGPALPQQGGACRLRRRAWAWSWPVVQFRAHSFSFPKRPVASRKRSTGIPQSLPDVPSDPQKQPRGAVHLSNPRKLGSAPQPGSQHLA